MRQYKRFTVALGFTFNDKISKEDLTKSLLKAAESFPIGLMSYDIQEIFVPDTEGKPYLAIASDPYREGKALEQDFDTKEEAEQAISKWFEQVNSINPSANIWERATGQVIANWIGTPSTGICRIR